MTTEITTGPGVDGHQNIHVDQGALPGEHPGRAKNPIIKAHDIAWLEFQKPDLVKAQAFAEAFGFTVTLRTAEELHLRGTAAGSPCVLIRKGAHTKYLGAAFLAADGGDVMRLAETTGRRVDRLPDTVGGIGTTLTDPSGQPVRIVADLDVGPELPGQRVHDYNFAVRHTATTDAPRLNATQRPPREPALVERLGHVVLQRARYLENLDWYLEHLGLIVSDFLYYDGQRQRGPVMSFIRCDRGATPSDHHTLALALGPSDRYVHSAYQVCDLDAIGAGNRYLTERGYKHSWGIGRHIQGSQLFDYWRDPDGFLVEHFSDGDLFDSSLQPGWAPMTATGLAQWGPPATTDFLGIAPGRASLQELRSIFSSLRTDNEFDSERLRGLLKVAST
ncbi:VOC family protein [Rhodococcus tibetensis]|uniref:VOC family protein n=1 Tax=Rhodococcus tibetensis TaxID=2965064 RepID=A0ABT1QGX0_9NOCA|nr:VOC family protein [Rhodococcus sp. FXJ9.536]MCQ4121035.1 VOC family protein [Rhodococcus sp. FXJ9.536]